METAMASLDRSFFFSPSSSSPSSSSSSAPSSNSLINTLLPPSFCASELEFSLLCRKRPNAHPFCAFRYISASHHIKRISSFASKSCIHGKYGSRKEDGSISQSLFLIDLLNALSTTVSPKRKRFSCHSSADDSSLSIGKEETETSAQLIGAGVGVFGNETQSHRWLETAEDGKGSGDFLQNNISKNEYGERDQLYGVGEFVAVGREEDVVQSDFKAEVERKSNESSSSLDTGILLKEPIYEVLEVKPSGAVFTKSISRRQLLKSSGLRLRDIRSVDPSLWITNSVPALLVRDQAILLNLGSLRAIGTPENVLIFDHKSIGAAAFLELLLQRLKPESNPGVPTMPFELEVVESALLSRTQRLERRLMEIEPRVLTLLEVLPNRLTANFLEELRLSKQGLVELGSKSGALRQMLLELLESPQEIRRMTIMGRRCTIKKDDGSIECVFPSDKHSADDEEEEIEMLLENYLQRCESCHGQAERLLDSAKEMEDSIAVNLSSRRLEVSRLELLLQVGTFCSALGALFAGIFGMNLKSYLETSTFAFWITTGGIIFGGIILFFIMYNHLKRRKIL